MPHKRVQIAIDVRYLSHGLVGGVHTYQRNLVETLLASDRGHNYALWADSKAPFDLGASPPYADLRVLPWSGPVSSLQNDRQLGVAMVRGGADVAHFPANYGFAPPFLPTVITLHDAINIMPLHEIWRGHAKRPKTLAMMTYLHLTTTRALRQQPLVVTVSEHARREILRHSDLNPTRVVAIHSAHEPIFRRLEDGAVENTRRRYGLSPRIVLADAIKNPACTLRAWRALPDSVREGTDLVFFSRREPQAEVRASADAGEVRLILRPARSELVDLYNLASVFVFPSWYEGFGLPVLEAMACGAPVISSDRGSLPEIIGSAGRLVDAEDHAAIARELCGLLSNPDRLADVRSRSLARAASFSWERTAQAMADVYTSLARPRRTHQAVATSEIAAD